MESFLGFLGNAGQRYQELSQEKKVAVWVLFAAAIGSLFAMSLWLKAPDYQLLYANLSKEDAAKIVEELRSKKIPFELTGGGTSIRVPSGQVHELRLNLATQGLPEGSEVGLELFEDVPLGMTEFVQKLNFQRGLQGELARTIKSLDVIEHARVHLVIPQDTLFLREKPKGKASIMVQVKKGRTLSEAQVQGIVHLVSSSVDGVAPQDVVVVDLRGNILSEGKEPSAEGMIASSNHKLKAKIEKGLENKVMTMLEDALGPGKIIAQVTADLDFEQVERTEEIFDPDSQVARSEQSTTESTLGAVPPGGIAGVQSLVPSAEPAPGVPGSAAKKDRENKTTNYEINKIVKHVRQPVGEIKKLSVSVLVDGIMLGDPPTYKARTPEELNTLLEIVKTAVGYNEDRGDQIKLENVQFDKSALTEEMARMESERRWEQAKTAAKVILGFIFIILFFTKIIRPLMTWMTTTVEVVPEEIPELGSPEEDAIEEEKRRLAELGTQSQELRKTVGEFASTDPKYTAGIIRRWMKERTH